MKKIKYLLLIFTICLICYACRKQQPLFGKEYNQERIKIGIPIIPDNWNAPSAGSDDANWYNPDSDNFHKAKIPFYVSKYVNYQSGILTYEQDEYFGREDFLWDGSLFRERIFITYKYNFTYGNQEFNWSATYSNKDGLSQDIGLSKAKEILKSWGLSYP